MGDDAFPCSDGVRFVVAAADESGASLAEQRAFLNAETPGPHRFDDVIAQENRTLTLRTERNESGTCDWSFWRLSITKIDERASP